MDIPYNLQRFLHNSYAQVGAVVDKSRNVVFGHLRQLFLEDALQARQDDCALSPPIVVDHSELNLPITLLYDSGLLWEGHDPFDRRRRAVIGSGGCGGARLLYALGGAVGRLCGRFALCYRGGGQRGGSRRACWLEEPPARVVEVHTYCPQLRPPWCRLVRVHPVQTRSCCMSETLRLPRGAPHTNHIPWPPSHQPKATKAASRNRCEDIHSNCPPAPHVEPTSRRLGGCCFLALQPHHCKERAIHGWLCVAVPLYVETEMLPATSANSV